MTSHERDAGVTNARPRGRPLRLPEDPGPMEGLVTNAVTRLAWVLITSRLTSSRSGVRDRRTFAQALIQVGVNADPTRLSRWESGTSDVPARALYGYEKVLGLRPGALTSLACELGRIAPDDRAPALLVSGVPDSTIEMDQLLRRVQEPDFAGVDWLTLVETIRSHERTFLPETMWNDLAATLVSSVVRSQGYARVTRDAAAQVLLLDPRSQRSMLRAIGAMVTSPGAPFLERALRHLSSLTSAGVTDLVIRMLDSAPGPTRRGAAWVVACKVGLGQLDPDQLHRLEEVLVGVCARSNGAEELSDAADVLASLPAARRDPLLERLGRSGSAGWLRSTADWGLVIAPDKSRQAVRQLCREVITPSGLSGPADTDRMLQRLLEEALFHVHRERRHQAAMLLEASPYSAPLAVALTAVAASFDSFTAARMLSLLAYLEPEPEAIPVLLDLGSAHADAAVRTVALHALWSRGPHMRRLDQEQVLAAALRDENVQVRTSATDTLGALGSALLARIVDDGDDTTRLNALWWQGAGPAVIDQPPSGAIVHQQYRPVHDD